MISLLWIAWATGSGKNTVIEEILRPLWFVSFRTSDMLKREIPKKFPKITDIDWLTPTKLAQLKKIIWRENWEDCLIQLALLDSLHEPQSIVDWLQSREEFDAIHTAGWWVILTISDIAKSVKRALDAHKRTATVVNTSWDEIRRRIKKEKKELDCLRNNADLVLLNNFSTSESFIEYARRQITDFLEQEDGWEE